MRDTGKKSGVKVVSDRRGNVGGERDQYLWRGLNIDVRKTDNSMLCKSLEPPLVSFLSFCLFEVVCEFLLL